MQSKINADKFVDFDTVQEDIFREIPGTRELIVENEPKRKIGLLLSRLRKATGLSQKDVASRAGWDKGFVSRIEGSFGVIPTAETITRYANACGATAGIVIVGTHIDADHIHIIEAITLPTDEGPIDSGALERLRATDIELPAVVGKAA